MQAVLDICAAMGLIAAGVFCFFHAAARNRKRSEIVAEWEISMRSVEYAHFTALVDLTMSATGAAWRETHADCFRTIIFNLFGEFEGRRVLLLSNNRLVAAIGEALVAKNIDEVKRQSVLMREFAEQASNNMAEPGACLAVCAYIALEAEYLKRTASSSHDAERAQKLQIESLSMLISNPLVRRLD